LTKETKFFLLAQTFLWKRKLYQRNMFFAKQKSSFLSTGSFYQTLGKFNQQTFRKSLTKNAAQASRKESVLEKRKSVGKFIQESNKRHIR
jgi:hypothetical protein